MVFIWYGSFYGFNMFFFAGVIDAQKWDKVCQKVPKLSKTSFDLFKQGLMWHEIWADLALALPLLSKDFPYVKEALKANARRNNELCGKNGKL